MYPTYRTASLSRDQIPRLTITFVKYITAEKYLWDIGQESIVHALEQLPDVAFQRGYLSAQIACGT
jgi:hypothetical protein